MASSNRFFFLVWHYSMLTIAWIIFLSPTTTSATQSPTSSLHTRHYPNSDLPIYQGKKRMDGSTWKATSVNDVYCLVEIVVDGPSQTTIDTQYQVCANTSNYRNARSKTKHGIGDISAATYRLRVMDAHRQGWMLWWLLSRLSARRMDHATCMRRKDLQRRMICKIESKALKDCFVTTHATRLQPWPTISLSCKAKFAHSRRHSMQPIASKDQSLKLYVCRLDASMSIFLMLYYKVNGERDDMLR